MFLPIGDTPNPRFTPWVNYALLAANVAFFVWFFPEMGQPVDATDPRLLAYLETLAGERGLRVSDLHAMLGQLSVYDLVVFDLGWRPGAPEALDLLTAMFLHGGLAHLAGNMLFLWIYGDNVEHRLGRLGYLAFYLAAGVAAGLGDAVLRPGSGIPSVGASGAISGVLGAYFLWFPHNKVKVFVFLFPIVMDVFYISARWVLGAYLVLDNLLPVLLAGGEGGVSYGAHIGGFVAGFGGAVAVRLIRPRRDGEGRAGEPEALLARGVRLEQQGDHVAAYQLYLQLLDRHPRASATQEAAIRAADILHATGQPRAAKALLEHAAKRAGVE